MKEDIGTHDALNARDSVDVFLQDHASGILDVPLSVHSHNHNSNTSLYSCGHVVQ